MIGDAISAIPNSFLGRVRIFISSIRKHQSIREVIMRRLIGLYTVIAVIIASAGSFAPMRQSDWSQWLGPHRDGVTQESSGYPK